MSARKRERERVASGAMRYFEILDGSISRGSISNIASADHRAANTRGVRCYVTRETWRRERSALPAAARTQPLAIRKAKERGFEALQRGVPRALYRGAEW